MPSLIRRRVLKSGKVRYMVRVPVPDAEGNPTFIRETFERETDAKKFVGKILGQRDQGLAAKASAELVKDFLDDWLRAVGPSLRENTFESYKALVDQHIKPRLGGVRLDRLTLSAIQSRLYAPMTAEGLSARTVRYVHSILHNSLDHAVELRKLTRNPAKGAKLPKKDGAEMRPFDQAEARGFLEQIKGDKLEAFFYISLSTGMRPSEIMALKWEDLDLEGGWVRITKTLVRVKKEWFLREPKTRRGRRSIKLQSETVDALERHKRKQLERKLKLGADWPDHGFVFVTVLGGPQERHNVVSRHFKSALKRLAENLHPAEEDGYLSPAQKAKRDDLMRVRLYDLRHTCATLALLAGVNPKVVSEMLGHASIVITLDTYSHVLPTMHEDASEKIAGILFG